jgi:hypothetical protein
MKTFHIFCLGILIFCSASCVFYISPVQRANQVNKSEAMFYGKFFYGRHFSEELNPSWYTTGLWIENTGTGHALYIEFKDTNYVYAVQVEPGIYRIAGSVRSDNEHGVKQRMVFTETNFPGIILKPFEARAGDQIYLGDYMWETKSDWPMMYWKLKSVDDQFLTTTSELLQACPGVLGSAGKNVFDRSLHLR